MTKIVTWRRVFLVGGLLLAALLISGLPIPLSNAFIARHGDAMDWRGSWLAGWHGVNCGVVGVGQDPAAATKCGLEAFAARRPFRVRYDIMGYDAQVAGGLVGTSNGNLYALSFDGNPEGSGGTLLFQQRVDVTECPRPTRLYVNPKGRLNCFQAELSDPRSVTSPNMEPY